MQEKHFKLQLSLSLIKTSTMALKDPHKDQNWGTAFFLTGILSLLKLCHIYKSKSIVNKYFRLVQRFCILEILLTIALKKFYQCFCDILLKKTSTVIACANNENHKENQVTLFLGCVWQPRMIVQSSPMIKL